MWWREYLFASRNILAPCEVINMYANNGMRDNSLFDYPLRIVFQPAEQLRQFFSDLLGPDSANLAANSAQKSLYP